MHKIIFLSAILFGLSVNNTWGGETTAKFNILFDAKKNISSLEEAKAILKDNRKTILENLRSLNPPEEKIEVAGDEAVHGQFYEYLPMSKLVLLMNYVEGDFNKNENVFVFNIPIVKVGSTCFIHDGKVVVRTYNNSGKVIEMTEGAIITEPSEEGYVYAATFRLHVSANGQVYYY